jgi:alkanesulfonate monooxygenase SsuD/methylene tetrahydromethanopterin reductase-like flavin-dependent oxidoreductase (luciferase family)
MQVGVGLPSAIPGTDGRALLGWARAADAGPFSTLGVLDRLRYDSFDPFVALAAAAGVTDRIRLATMVAVGPIRSAAMLAKEAASVDSISGGRLTLGLAIGARTDDYDAAGVTSRGRGPRLDDQLVALRELWEAGVIGPRPAREEGPRILVGGLSGEAFDRMARSADGYAHGGGPPRAFASAATRALAAWRDAERPGRPILWGQGYFALGGDAAEAGRSYLLDYYAFAGPFADKIAAGALTSPQAIIDFVRGYEQAGCDELILLPTVSDPAQLERLADVVG